MRHGGVVAAVALATGVMMFGPRLQLSQAAPAQVIQYQGRLTDLNAVPLEGQVYELRFKVFSSPTPSAAAFVWGERHRNVPVNRGVFTVHLGSGLEAIDVNDAPAGPAQGFTSQFDGSARFVQVTVLRTATDTPEQLSPLNQVGSVPYAIQAGGSVPLGGIVDWFRPTASTPVPAGWALCNGLAVNDPDSPLNGQATPDLQGKFVRGLENVAAVLSSGAYGFGAGSPQTGGQDLASTAHAHGIPNHDHGIEHTHSVSDHTHGFSFSASGRTGGANQNPPQELGPSYQGGPFVHQHNFSVSFSGTTGGTSGGVSTSSPSQGRTSSDSLSTFTAGGAIDNRPAYVGLVKIIRIR